MLISYQLLGTRATPRIATALKRRYENLKVVFAENRRYQFEKFRGSSVFLQQVSDEY